MSFTEENGHLDFDVVVTGLKPASVETSVICHITHHPKPLILAVMVTFKGPMVTPSVPSVDFGLVELGGRAQTSLTLTNMTHLKATWALKEREDPQDSQVLNLQTAILVILMYVCVRRSVLIMSDVCVCG